MAVDSFECKIITGGFYHCGHTWSKNSDELDRCFKIYNPVDGEAFVTIDGIEHKLEPGNIYLLSGFNIESQRCNSFMDIYWLHFIPTSLYLRHILLKSNPMRIWNKNDFPFMEDFNQCVKSMFKDEFFLSKQTSVLPYSFEEAKLQSYLLRFIADLLKSSSHKERTTSDDLLKIEPSIEFMKNEFINNPSLSEIASKSVLATNYFHRLFKKNFGLTPFNYMLRLRMEIAIRLLTTTSKSIKEIACEAGYENEFYFYRLFKKQYNCSPGKLKKMRPF